MGSGCLYVLRERQVVDLSSDESIPPVSPTATDGISDECEKMNENDHSLSKSEFDANLHSLNEMFDMLPQDDIRKALLDNDVNRAVDHLIHQVEAANSTTPRDEERSQVAIYCGSSTTVFNQNTMYNEVPSLKSLLQGHRSDIMDSSAEHVLSVDRSTSQKIWQSAVCFYKSAMTKPLKLRKELIVQFDATGEVGADSGALRREFFEDAIYQANSLLLEGEDDRRVLKKDWGLEMLAEIMGMLVAHSITQEGPGIPCLSPCMYEYMVKGNTDECYPVKEDIPLNIATHGLITFIEELNDAHTQDSIDEVLDKPSNGFILNNSGWCVTDTIVPANKLRFLQDLIHDEVIVKREQNLKAFCRGLDSLSIGRLIKKYPDIMKNLFVAQNENVITADIFLSLMTNDLPKNENEERAISYFKNFVVHIETEQTSFVSVPALIRFITGSSTIPPLGLSIPIRICYQYDENSAIFPKAQACFSKLYLPVTHEDQDSFNMAFKKALEYGAGYGNP